MNFGFNPYNDFTEAFQNQVQLGNIEWRPNQSADAQLIGKVDCKKRMNEKVNDNNVDELYGCYQQIFNQHALDVCKQKKPSSYYPEGPSSLLQVSNLTFNDNNANTMANYTQLIQSINTTLNRHLEDPSYYQTNKNDVDKALQICTGREPDNTNINNRPRGIDAILLHYPNAAQLFSENKIITYSKMHVLDRDIIPSINYNTKNYDEVVRLGYKEPNILSIYQGTLRFKNRGYYYFRTFVPDTISHQMVIQQGDDDIILFNKENRIGVVEVNHSNFREAFTGLNYTLRFAGHRGTNIGYYYSENKISGPQLSSLQWTRLTADDQSPNGVIPILLSKPINRVARLEFVNSGSVGDFTFTEMNIIKENGLPISKNDIRNVTGRIINFQTMPLGQNDFQEETNLSAIFDGHKNYKLSRIPGSKVFNSYDNGTIEIGFNRPLNLGGIEVWQNENINRVRRFFVATTNTRTQFIFSFRREKFFSRKRRVEGKDTTEFGIKFGLYPRTVHNN
jgi:hypothetical protein